MYAAITTAVKKSEDVLSNYSSVPNQLQLGDAIDQLKVLRQCNTLDEELSAKLDLRLTDTCRTY